VVQAGIRPGDDATTLAKLLHSIRASSESSASGGTETAAPLLSNAIGEPVVAVGGGGGGGGGNVDGLSPDGADDRVDDVGVELAPVPPSTPMLPSVLGSRPSIFDTIVSKLTTETIATADPADPLSASSRPARHDTVRRERTVAAVGMGGSGKTIMAAAVVRSTVVRRHFDRIAMVVVGQTPELMKVQRDFFVQLTGRRLADIVSADATMASNAEHIRTAAAGRRWLLVLDDVWDPIHEEQLCFFTDQCKACRMLVTTRFQGLLEGSAQVQLGLLAADETVELLFETARVARTEPRAAVMAELGKLCGYLPLFVGMVGRQIAEYGEDTVWEKEVPDMLKENRSSVFDARGGSGGSGVGANIIDSILATIQEEQPHIVLSSIAVCPEDVPVPPEVLELVWCAKQGATMPLASVAKMQIRMAVLALLNRNLLLGAPGAGVKLHDVVRDTLRARVTAAEMMTQQRRMVALLLSVTAETGVDPADASSKIGTYCTTALRQHMVEAVDPAVEPINDVDLLQWLSYAPARMVNDFAIMQAASVFGAVALSTKAMALEERAEYLDAANCHFAAAQAVEWGMMCGSDQAAAFTGGELSLRSGFNCCLQIEEQTSQPVSAEIIRLVKLVAAGRLFIKMNWSDPEVRLLCCATPCGFTQLWVPQPKSFLTERHRLPNLL